MVKLSYFVVEYDGLAPARLENTTINTLLAKGDLDESVNFCDLGEQRCFDNNDIGALYPVIGIHTILVHHRIWQES